MFRSRSGLPPDATIKSSKTRAMSRWRANAPPERSFQNRNRFPTSRTAYRKNRWRFSASASPQTAPIPRRSSTIREDSLAPQCSNIGKQNPLRAKQRLSSETPRDSAASMGSSKLPGRLSSPSRERIARCAAVLQTELRFGQR